LHIERTGKLAGFIPFAGIGLDLARHEATHHVAERLVFPSVERALRPCALQHSVLPRLGRRCLDLMDVNLRQAARRKTASISGNFNGRYWNSGPKSSGPATDRQDWKKRHVRPLL